MLFNRFSIVPELSSAARIPFPGATSFLAMDSKLSVFMIFFIFVELNFSPLPRKIFLEMQMKSGSHAVIKRAYVTVGSAAGATAFK